MLQRHVSPVHAPRSNGRRMSISPRCACLRSKEPRVLYYVLSLSWYVVVHLFSISSMFILNMFIFFRLVRATFEVDVLYPRCAGLWRGGQIERRRQNGLEYDRLVPGTARRTRRRRTGVPPSAVD